MATIIHACSSPRRHQNISSVSHLHQQMPPFNYNTTSKYTRTTPSYYEENAITCFNNFHTLQPKKLSVIPGNKQRPCTYENGIRPSSIGPTSNLTGYWIQGPNEPIYRISRHQKHKSAAEVLQETKNLYLKADKCSQRQQDTMYRNQSLTDFNKRSGCCREFNSQVVIRPAVDMQPQYVAKYRFPRSKICMERGSITSNKKIVYKNFGPIIKTELRQTYRRSPHNDVRKEGIRTDYDELIRTKCGMQKPHSKLRMDKIYMDKNCDHDEPLVLTENYRPISPPAEYAADAWYWNQQNSMRQNYKRSLSHSQEPAVKALEQSSQNLNIDSHKSLPDLYTQSNRQSPHSEILSCCSRGNRSIKSTDESSFNRDSCGSSGHFTGSKSEPCCRPDTTLSNCRKNCYEFAIRRDSGSSTQPSSNSFYKSLSPSGVSNLNILDSTSKSILPEVASDFSFTFLTPEVPVQFQDDYKPVLSPSKIIKNSFHSIEHNPDLSRTSEHQSLGSLVLSSDSVFSTEEPNYPPPMQFKRQKCIRFKNRNHSFNIPTKSQSINTEQAECIVSSFDNTISFDQYGKCYSLKNEMSKETEIRPRSNSLQNLDNFFDLLGLNDETFQDIYMVKQKINCEGSDNSERSSPVFFSDVSTVDSMNFPDSTENNSQSAQLYRPSEPPSIVERNARIIKWLCNCKRAQIFHTRRN